MAGNSMPRRRADERDFQTRTEGHGESSPTGGRLLSDALIWRWPVGDPNAGTRRDPVEHFVFHPRDAPGSGPERFREPAVGRCNDQYGS